MYRVCTILQDQKNSGTTLPVIFLSPYISKLLNMAGMHIMQLWRICFRSGLIILLHSVSFMECRELETGEDINLSVMLPAYPLPDIKGDYPWLKKGRLFPYHLQMVVPAMRIAVEKVKERQLIPNHNITLHVNDTHCSINTAQLVSADIFIEHRVMGFFGPVCEYPAGPVGRFSAHWNVPQLTAGAQASGYSGPPYDKTLTNIMPPHSKMGDFVGQIFQKYKWTRAVFLYHDGNNFIRDMMFMAGSVFGVVSRGFNMNVTNQDFDEFVDNLDYADLLQRTVTRYARAIHKS
ncbi:atrial natriuretic peptide receptor 1-like [Lytechinus variegatus]|uniref:atrial natriuretic peptide receptor 1-like n=1 Tax=Lytechinus variegatus TaxID=7654 RepID=UPI001BB132E3|nr:atrial natriuretic peptide receptor 1-like [Lytechinus variegatus]